MELDLGPEIAEFRAELRDWIDDPREFQPLRQYEDWMQVIGDFNESVAETGPKLTTVVQAVTTQIESRLQRLFQPTEVAPQRPSPIRSLIRRFLSCDAVTNQTSSPHIDPLVREEIRSHLDRLDTELATDAAIVAAWNDLRTSAEKSNRTSEEISYRRDIVWALAERRNLDIESSFSVFRDVSAVLRDNADAVQEELDWAAGVEHEIVTYPGAPHSFFDRKQEEFADASEDAWRRVLDFVRSHVHQ